jgi:protein arginine kinase activator
VTPGNGKKCVTCGFTLDDLKRVRRFGCSDCYATFSDEVAQMVRGMHKGTSHIGKVPEGLMAVQFRNQRIEELRSRLEQAITSESYEEAAGIRDEIRNLDEVKL